MKRFSITSHLFMKEAERRGWKSEILSYENDLIALYPSKIDRPIWLRRATSELSTGLGLVIANDKILTSIIAAQIDVPIPETLLYTSQRKGFDLELSRFLRKSKQVVVKPIDCCGGVGITTNITDEASLFASIDYAKKFSPNILIQSFVAGDDYRILVLNGHVIAATWRRPPFIIGNGVNTIAQLVETENVRRLMNNQEGESLSEINIDDVENFIGTDQLNSVPERGVQICLLGVANVSRGGITCDVTECMHPSIFRLAEKISNACHLSLCGVDLLIEGDISKPIDSGCQATVIEINATPGLRMHHFPAIGGHARNVAGAILDEIIRRRCLKNQVEQEMNADHSEYFAELILEPNTYLSLSKGESEFHLMKMTSISN